MGQCLWKPSQPHQFAANELSLTPNARFQLLEVVFKTGLELASVDQ